MLCHFSTLNNSIVAKSVLILLPCMKFIIFFKKIRTSNGTVIDLVKQLPQISLAVKESAKFQTMAFSMLFCTVGSLFIRTRDTSVLIFAWSPKTTWVVILPSCLSSHFSYSSCSLRMLYSFSHFCLAGRMCSCGEVEPNSHGAAFLIFVPSRIVFILMSLTLHETDTSI